jgi:uncharacterized membrane protein YphA (DoxX/SURF4 family)
MNSSPATLNSKTTESHEVAWQRWGMFYLRIALGVSFLSGIADRFGLYTGKNVGYGNFAGFMRYTAQVNSFMPASTIPFLAWSATVAELAFGLALVLGIWLRWAALGSSILLLLFGTAMAISFGIKSPPHSMLAGILAQQGRTAEAAAERKKAADLTRMAVNRQRATFVANTGRMLLLKNQITDAIERYQEALSSDPTYVEAHRGLATALERAGRTAEAEAEKQRATQLDQAGH